MKLYTITTTSPPDWDTYVGAVVAAHNENEARNTHPHGEVWDGEGYYADDDTNKFFSFIDTWVKPESVIVEYIGEASKNIEKQCVIMLSYNAG